MVNIFAYISFVFVFEQFRIAHSRPAPADEDICIRFPTSGFCRQRHELKLQQQQHLQSPERDDETERYCSKWDKHYAFYCEGLGTGDRRANEFCPYYKKTCNPNVKKFTPPPLPNEANAETPPTPFPPVHSVLAPNSLAQSNRPFQQPQPQLASLSTNQANSGGGLNQANNGGGQNSGNSGSGGGLNSIGQPLAFLGGPNSAVAGTSNGVPGNGAPLGIGRGVGVGPFASAFQGTNINPLSGVNQGTSINAAGLPISASQGVNFGGLIPGGLSNLFGGSG